MAVLSWVLGPAGGLAETVPMIPVPQAFVTELGMTAILGFVIMAVATDERSSPGWRGAWYGWGDREVLEKLGGLGRVGICPARHFNPSQETSCSLACRSGHYS